jgi:hypothetical protein
MCECKPYGRAHAYEPGESCSPSHVMPLEAQKLAAEQQRDRLLEAVEYAEGQLRGGSLVGAIPQENAARAHRKLEEALERG